MRATWVLRTMVAFVSLTLGYAGVVSASNWGAGVTDQDYRCLKVGDANPAEYLSECTADDQYFYVYVDGDVPTWFRDAVATSVATDYDPLPGFTATLQSSLNSNTDTRVRKKDIREDWSPIYTTCSGTADFGGGSGYYRWCKRQIIFLEPSRLNQNWKDWYACHELGHTVGLQHPGLHSSRITCMDYDHDVNLDAHDQQHLVDCYPRPIPAPSTLTPSCRDYAPTPTPPQCFGPEALPAIRVPCP